MLLCSILFNTAVSMLTSMYISQSAQYQIGIIYNETWASQVAQRLKHLPAMREAWVRSLGQEDPWRRKWHPTPVLFPGESHGWRSLVGYSPQGRKESDTTERLHVHFHFLTAKLGEKMQPIRHQLIFNLPLWQSMCKARQDNQNSQQGL